MFGHGKVETKHQIYVTSLCIDIERKPEKLRRADPLRDLVYSGFGRHINNSRASSGYGEEELEHFGRSAITIEAD